MKQSTKLAYFFFLISILLEIFSTQTMTNDLRLFVGVFVVLGITFMIHSIQEFIGMNGNLLFEDGKISRNNLIEPNEQEYLMKEDKVYLWINDSPYLDWEDMPYIYQFVMGVFATIGGWRPSKNKQKYIIIRPKQDIYVEEDNLGTLSNVASIEHIESGDDIDYYSKASIYGMYFCLFFAGALILIFVIYILSQLI